MIGKVKLARELLYAVSREGDDELDTRVCAAMSLLTEALSSSEVLMQTGAEPYCMGWEIARFEMQNDRLPAHVGALGGCVLRGYRACWASMVRWGKVPPQDQAMKAWTTGRTDA